VTSGASRGTIRPLHHQNAANAEAEVLHAGSPDDRHTNRRAFLTTVAGGTAALAASLGARELLAQGRGFPDYPAPQGGWDLSWVDRVEKAKHRMVFDQPEVADGLAETNALVYLMGYRDVYQTADADMGVVIVVRHAAIPAVLNDDMWARLKLGEDTKMKDPTSGETAKRNPLVNVKADDKHAATLADGGLDSLIARGVIVLVCNLALMRFGGKLAKAANIPVEEAHKTITASLVPGCIRQPSGIFAVARAQEAGCHFLRST
jgi:intracellular sulfur oxidation DsrE/DsrF family protein